MTRSKNRIHGLVAALILGATILPGVAQAAVPADPQVIVFGNVAPDFAPLGKVGDPGWDDPTFGHDSLFANSLPFGQGERGDAYFYGLGDPDVIIDVTVTDGTTTIGPISLWTAPASSDPDTGSYVPGQFGYGVPSRFRSSDFLNAITVTGLGVHEAETDTVVNPVGPASTDPAHWGPSVLTFSFQARDPSNPADVSAVVTDTLTKYAGTPDDVTNPAVQSGTQWPPEHWCHLAGRGANEPFGGNTFGGDARGKCSDFAQAPFPAFPDIMWIFCIEPTSEPLDVIDPNHPIPTDFFDVDGDGRTNDNPFRDFYCSSSPSRHVPTGEARVQGIFTDLPFGASGVGSEIADVDMKVFRGSSLWLDYPDVETYRAGPASGWGQTLKIADFEPSWPDGETYTVQVTVTDAWGRAFSQTSPEINVYPY